MPPPRELALVFDAHERAGSHRAAGPQPVPGADAALVRQARSGDSDAFGALYQTHRAAVFATCLNRLRDRHLAEDAVQDTFLRAYASLSRFDERRPLAPWLNAIAVRRCIDTRRRSSRTTTSEDIEDHLPEGPQLDPTLDAVIALEEGGRLARALLRLHPRQRRALLLHALDGWSYADIASAEGISVASTKSLLFHARANLRRACRRGLIGTIAVALLALRRRAGRGAMTIRTRLGAGLEALTSSVAPVSSSVAAVVLSLTAATAPAVAVRPTSFTSGLAAAVAPPGSGSAIRNIAAGVAQGSGSGGLADSLLHPTKNATPEQTQFTSVAPSPNYDEDHTLVAAGSVPCPQGSCSVLFISHDAGHTWTRRETKNFRGYQILLPPSYPRDPTIFAMGDWGLQLAADGLKFESAAPFEGDVAMSPIYDVAEKRLLIGATVVTEYWADQDLAKPAALIGPAGTWLTVAFSPSYAADRIIFVGGIRPDTTGKMRPTVNRCVDSVCESVVFTDGIDAPWLRPSPGFATDQTIFAFTSGFLFRSVDGAKTFTTAVPPFAGQGGSIEDLRVADDGTLIAAVQNSNGGPNGVFRSYDGGATWTGVRVRLAGFEQGVAHIVQLPDGNLIALAVDPGIACSADGGRSWAARCSR